MPITDTGKKIGQTTWQATVFYDDGVPESLAFAEYPERALGLAKAWAGKRLLTEAAKERPPGPYADPAFTPYWCAEIKRGTYRDESFDDPGHGHVTDGTWERDESAGGYLYGSVAKSGEGVEWDRY